MYHSYDHKKNIKGIGTDIVDIRRFEAMDEQKKTRLAKKILTQTECLQYQTAKNTSLFLAKHFSAKESIAKTLGTGFRGFGFRDIELRTTALGRPTVALSERAGLIADKKNITAIQLSVSHEQHYVLCFCVAE